MKLTSLLQLVDKLQQAGKIDSLQRVEIVQNYPKFTPGTV